jgi:acetyltransferase-like isoleucine patch superfamily enzyme
MSTSQQPVEPPYGNALKPSLRRRLATSQSFPARLLRWAYYTINNFSVPAPRIVVRPLLWVFLLVRNAYYFIARVFICEPYFKAFCTQYGRNLHTAAHLHWITGKGDIVIGDNTGIGGGCVFTVGKLIEIGRNCNFSGSIQVMDSNGHDTDPTARWKHEAPLSEDVRPVFIRDNVWIGKNCIIFPGVKIGEGSVISAGSVVRSHVPPYAVVAGNPAKVIFRLKKPDPSTLA